jgi:hypothetical protein
MLPTLHQPLIDYLARIILARLDMDRLLHDRIRAAAEGFARAVLFFAPCG